MPVNKSLYPDNWNSLALKVKEAAQWRCECCGKSKVTDQGNRI